jgi:hypothetical protein
MDGIGAVAIITNIPATIAQVIRFTGLEIATRRTFKKNRISLLTRIASCLSYIYFALRALACSPYIWLDEGISARHLPTFYAGK